MNHILIYLVTLTLVSGGSLASTSTDVSSGAVLQSELPALSAEQRELPEEWSVMAPGQPFTHDAVNEEVIHLAGRFKKGVSRDIGRRGLRGAEPGRPGRIGDPGGLGRGVDVDRRVDVDRDIDIDRDVDVDIDDDDHEVGAALIGIGIGAAIANSDDPDYTCVNSNCDY